MLKMENRPEGQMVMEPHPEKAADSHNRRVMGEDGLFIPATLACIRKHSHTCLFVENEAASMCVTVDFNRGGLCAEVTDQVLWSNEDIFHVIPVPMK